MPEVRTPIEPSEDTISILVTTDNHVGYKENDPIIGDDAWKSFEEIMGIAKENDVDMVLQSGDLFHINKPSKKSLFQVMRVLRSNCLGDRPCELELLSDPSETLDDGFNVVNYEDPNINVSIPVFAISGNHDDSTGDSLLSPMDVLNVSGLVNHFGRVLKNDDITVTPMLFQKGTTKLALYGLASVLDERLFRTFRDGQVKFKTPSMRKGEWFNLMAVHQNHHAHTETSYLPENFLPNFLDLVVWGHEHECIPYTVTNFETNFETLQPGSSVATSLSDAETVEKHVFIINIKNRDYHVQPVKLKTIRPFVMKDISLSNSGIMPGTTSRPQVTRYLTSKVNELINEAKLKWREQNPELFEGDSEADIEQEEEEQEQEQEEEVNRNGRGERGEADDQNGAGSEDKRYPLPLIRLRVDYSGGYEVENPRRFSNMFVGKVANVNDIILFHRRKDTNGSKQKSIKLKDVVVEENASIKVQSFVNSFLQESQLSLLPEIGINAAVKNFVDKEDKSALETFINKELQNDIKLLSRTEIEEDNELINFIKKNKKNLAHMAKTIEAHPLEDTTSRGKAAKNTTGRKTPSKSAKSSEIIVSESDDDTNMDDKAYRSMRTAESSRPVIMPTTTTASRKRGRVAPKPVTDPVEIVSDSEPEEQRQAAQRKTTTKRKAAPPRPKPVASKRGAKKRHDFSDEEEKDDDYDDYDDDDNDDDDEQEEEEEDYAPPAKKKRNVGKAAPVEDDENDMDSEEEPTPRTKTNRKRGGTATSIRGRGRGRGRGGSKAGGGDSKAGSQSIDQLLSQFGRR